MSTQAHRELEFFSPLGEDVLLLRKFKATEELGCLYKIELDLRSLQEDIDIESILGQNVTVRLDVSGASQRYFNGYVTSFSQEENSEGFATYKAVVSPWIWFLQRTKDCQIFQEMSVVDIIEKVLGDNEYTDYGLRLDNSYRKRENTVQYRETSFNFISRLMEEEGIYYFFEHGSDRHKLILCDSRSAHEIIPTYDSIAYYPPDATTVRNEEIINRWKQEYTVVSGSVALDDYDFEKPGAIIGSKYSRPKFHVNSEGEIFDYPGKYLKEDEGEHYARVRQEGIQCDYAITKGESTAREFSAGGLMKMEKHPREDQNIEYLITKVVHQADQDAFSSTKKGGSGFIYKNKFKVISVITPFKSKQKSKASVVEGSQNAVVVGPSSEEIYCDKYGRIKVQFPWDRYGKSDENSSCWIRVSQNWAGRKWGAIHIPRIGQEVIVDFLEGNPDRPLVTGKVYNADQMPPYDLPSKKNVSGIKTRSTKGGGGFNEMTMDDTKGNEQIFIHAQNQHDQRTNKNHLSWVGKHQHHRVEGTYYDDVYGDKHHTVGGELNFFVKDALSIETQGDIHQKTAQDYAHESGKEIHLKAGMKIVLEAGVQISLKAGGSFIDIGPAGVSIKGPMVNINSGGSPASGVGSEPEKAKLPKDADNRQPPGPVSPPKKRPLHELVPAASVLRLAAKNNTPFCEECEKAALTKDKTNDTKEDKTSTENETNSTEESNPSQTVAPPPAENKVDTGYINIYSNYHDFQNIGVSYSLSITDASGKVLEESSEVKLPIGSLVYKKYGPFPIGMKQVTITPLLNYNKQSDSGGSIWTQDVNVPPNGEVDAKFSFVETDSWDSRYTTVRINRLDANQRQRFLIFINKIEEDTGYKFRVADGLRTNAEQDKLYCNSRPTAQYCINKGFTNGTGAWRSNAKAGESYHNYGLAVDIYRFGENNELINPSASVGVVGNALGLTWGNSFNDPPHFQYSVQPIANLQAGE